MLLQGAALGGVAAGTPAMANAAVSPLLDKLQRDEFPLPEFAEVIGEQFSVKGADGSRASATSPGR